jgi:hypothetical protein
MASGPVWSAINLAAALLAGVGGGAALAADAPSLPTVTYNVGLRAFENVLPHRTPFQIKLTVSGANADYDEIDGASWKSDGKRCEKRPDTARLFAGTAGDKDDSGQRTFVLQAPRLQFATAYCFRFTLSRNWSKQDQTAVAAAAEAALAAAETRGSYSATTARAALEKSLGDRARLPVVVNDVPNSAPMPLIHLVAAELTVAALKPLFQQQRDYHDNIDNARRGTRDLIAKAPPPPASMAQDAPRDVSELEDTYKAVVDLANSLPRLSADLVPGDIKAAAEARPAPLSDDEKAYYTKLELLLNHIETTSAARCKPANADTSKYCDALGVLRDLAKKIRRNLETATDNARGFLSAEADILRRVKARVAKLVVQLPPTEPLTTDMPGYTERSLLYISADVGGVLPVFLWGGGADVSAFIGVNVYFTAVDKDVPLAEEEDFAFLKRFSLTAGWTLTDIKDSSGSAKGALGGKGLMAGGGLRVTDYLRIGAGAMFVTQRDANPVVPSTHLRVTPYGAISIDVDVAGTIRGSVSKSNGGSAGSN